jgi:hypothetical protein
MFFSHLDEIHEAGKKMALIKKGGFAKQLVKFKKYREIHGRW